MTQNPFSYDIFPDGLPGSAGALTVHHQAVERLLTLVGELGAKPGGFTGGGRAVLLRAPRAGFGKSHLIDRVTGQLSGKALVFPGQIEMERDIKWSALFWQVLEHCDGMVATSSPKLSALDEVARRAFSLVNQQLIREEKVPCAHPASAIAALESRYVELFELNDPNQAVGKWFLDHFERLLPATGQILARQAGLEPTAAQSWLRILCAYTQGIADGPAVRLESLRWALQQSSAPGISAGGMMITTAPTLDETFYRGKLEELGRIAGLLHPLVFVFDHLDALYGSREKATRLASMMAEIRRMLPQSLLIVSMNQDLWAETFLPALPSALEDRLTGGQIMLGGLNRQEAEILLRQRLRHAGVEVVDGEAFLARLDLGSLMVREAGRLISPRVVLRFAANLWDDLNRQKVGGRTILTPLSINDAPLFGPESKGAPDAPPPAIKPLAGTGAFEHLRSTLASSAPPASGVVLDNPLSPELLPQLGAQRSDTNTSPILAEYQTLRQRLRSGPGLHVDVDRLCHLLAIAGRRLALVRSGKISVAGSDGQEALLWQTPDGEVTFGCEPGEDTTYWRALIAATRERFKSLGASAPRSGLRLVVFSSVDQPLDTSPWLAQDELLEARSRFLDIVSLDTDSLASLYAADELLLLAEKGDTSSTEQILVELAPELDFFWKRVTRPLAAPVGWSG